MTKPFLAGPFTVVLIAMQLAIPLVLFSQTFTRITTGPPVSGTADSRSVNWVDVNNDNLVDLFISNGPSGGQNNFLYINNGGGNFTAVTLDPIVMDNAPSDGATFSDSDNDGDLDAFVVNWYDVDNLYYLNNGNGSFTQNTTINIANDAGFSETASWGDYDKDGLNDLYVTNSSGVKRNFLYHNDGNQAFTKITTGSVVLDQFESRSVNWTDLDNDNDLDLFVTNESGQHENIYRNDGAGVFTKITSGAIVTNGGNTMSSSVGDYDNDGDLDIFLANDQGDNALFRNDGSMTFSKILNDTVGNSNGYSFSSAWSDIDNDGDLDLFVTNAFHGFVKHVNFLYLNNGGAFTRINNTSPATDSTWAYGCAFGDYDNDGFEDLAVATVRFNNVDQNDLLYHNDGNSNHWITIRLKGTPTNAAAIGTKIRIKAVINGNAVWQMREISAQTSYCGQNDLRAHFGLGNATVIDSIRVEWLSGNVEHFTSVQADLFVDIVEGQGMNSIVEPKTLAQNRLQLFPNPGKGNVTFRIEGRQIRKGDHVTITRSNGAVVCSYVVDHKKAEEIIDLKRCGVTAQSTFFVSVKTTEGVFTGKFVKID